MRILIVEDDDSCRKVLLRFLSPFGQCDAVADGLQGVQAVQKALDERSHYTLICLDIHMPNMDGHEAMSKIRILEEDSGVGRDRKAKIMMCTALGDALNLTDAFGGECDAYIVKPFDHARLKEQLYLMGLIPDPSAAAPKAARS